MFIEQFPDSGCVAEIVRELGAPCPAALVGECGVARVWTLIDPLAKRLTAAAGKRLLEERAVFQGDDVPVHAVEYRVHAMEDAVADHRVEALAVVVDDPPQLADVV